MFSSRYARLNPVAQCILMSISESVRHTEQNLLEREALKNKTNKKKILLLWASLQKAKCKLEIIFVISFSTEPKGAKKQCESVGHWAWCCCVQQEVIEARGSTLIGRSWKLDCWRCGVCFWIWLAGSLIQMCLNLIPCDNKHFPWPFYCFERDPFLILKGVASLLHNNPCEYLWSTQRETSDLLLCDTHLNN